MPSRSRINNKSVARSRRGKSPKSVNPLAEHAGVDHWSRDVLLAALIANAMTMFIAWDPFGLREREPFTMFVIASIFAQACLFTLPGLLLARRWRRLGLVVMAVPLAIVMADAAVYRMIDSHLISEKGWAAIETMPQWFGHTGWAAWRTVMGLTVGFAATVATCFSVANLVMSRAVAPARVGYGVAAFVTLAALITGFSAFQTRIDIGRSPFQHPLSIAGIWRPVPITFSDLGIAPTMGLGAETNLQFSSPERDQRERAVRLIQTRPTPNASLPDVVIIVVESFRHELVDADVMPNLHAAATEGLWCREHYSSGNATSHGMFSLMTGMDATWFGSGIRFRPPMIEIFRDAGYELGFFAGHDDWRRFYMDGFVSEERFDEFKITRPDGLASDRLATAETLRFLDRDQSGDAGDSPRLAMLYLYATHSPYLSYADDQIFEPTIGKDFPIPYGGEDRIMVWNRYRSSARTVDGWLKLFLRDIDLQDRIVVIVGDHGEAFLEDGTIGHGTKLSRVQTMTPLVIAGPRVVHREIGRPTMHADLLPTLVELAGIEVTGLESLDGISLVSEELETPRIRPVVLRDYLGKDVITIAGPSAAPAE